MQTRTKLKEAYDIQLAATIERAEKQIILARHARRLLNYIDDSAVVPGDARPAYENELQARQVLEDAETDLRAWEPSVEPIASAARGASVSDEEARSVTHGDSMVNDVPSASKQLEEPQSADHPEVDPVPLAS